MPLSIRTIRDAAEDGYRFAVECRKCKRSEFVTATELVEQGQGDKPITADFRCRGCGQVAEVRLHPPAPTR